MKAKIERLEKDVNKMDKEHVNLDLFHATIEPLRDATKEIQRDIKKILGWLTRHDKKDALND
jgi:hypothetical protein